MTRARAAGALLLGAVLAAFVLLGDSPESAPDVWRPAESVSRPASAPPGSPAIAERTGLEPGAEGASTGSITAHTERVSQASEALPGDPPSVAPRGPAAFAGAAAPTGPSAAPPTRPRTAVGVVPSGFVPPTEDDVVERFRDTYGDPDPAHERQMIEVRRERSLRVVEGLMAGLAEQEEAARRAGDTERADQLARSVRRLEWRHQVLDQEPGAAAEPAEAVDTPAP